VFAYVDRIIESDGANKDVESETMA
jgi:hypothetical protein